MLSFNNILLAFVASSLVVHNGLAATSRKADACNTQNATAVDATSRPAPALNTVVPATPTNNTVPDLPPPSCMCPAPPVCPVGAPPTPFAAPPPPAPLPAAPLPVPMPDMSVVSPTSQYPSNDTTSGSASLNTVKLSGVLVAAVSAMLL